MEVRIPLGTDLENHNKSILTAVFYREWSRGGVKTEEGQINRIAMFGNQIEKASVNNSVSF